MDAPGSLDAPPALLLSIGPQEPLWLALAFLLGLLVKRFGLPALTGYILAGFILHAAGAKGGDFLDQVGDLGITLLLFTIGLKLRLALLASPAAWGVASAHMLLMSVINALFLGALHALGLIPGELSTGTLMLAGFALSFSSTVFAVKILNELGAEGSRHGNLAIGVLIMQDIAAVAFLAASSGKLPSLWALGLLALPLLRRPVGWLLARTDHGELMILFGVVLALAGADLFELVGIKGDLGALAAGMLVASHPKADELAKSLLGFKDLFLLGFFLSVGMTALPSWESLLLASLLMLLLPLKTMLYFFLFLLARIRAGNAWRAASNLANYSEFSLIVGSVAVASGWLDPQWIAVFAIALSLSYILGAPIIAVRDQLYRRWRPLLKRLEHPVRVAGEEDLSLGPARIAVFGMGRIGTSAYDRLDKALPGAVVGVDFDDERIDAHQAQGRHVVRGDPTNPDFWTRLRDGVAGIEWILLALPSHQANLMTLDRLREIGYQGRIAATTRHPDEAEALRSQGVHLVYDLYQEAGQGFADTVEDVIFKGKLQVQDRPGMPSPTPPEQQP